ncbi:MAG TPA: hypothetical protein VE130_05405 [Nitrososphaeraceae archaeon]|nr:hypothetical protein [Nitrososphaeraceae archaeon]
MTFGHNFSTDESASFIGSVDLIKTQAQLVQDNIASNNITLASEHANDALALLTDDLASEIAERNQRIANELNTTLTDLKAASEAPPENTTGTKVEQIVSDLDAILDEALTARIEPTVLANSTTIALALTDVLDGVLNAYGDAYAVNFDMTNMSMVMGQDGSHSMDMGGEQNSMGSMEMGDSNMSSSNVRQGMQPVMGDTKMELEKGKSNQSMQMDMMSSNQGSELVNLADYQTAQALAVKAKAIFDSQLSNGSSNTQALNNIGSALQELVKTIDSKGTPMDVMTIVHTKIHPNMITAFELQLTS